MKVPILWRFRLELAPRATVNRPGEMHLYRFKDPQTGVVYVGRYRFDPFLVRSVINELDMTVQTESDR